MRTCVFFLYCFQNSTTSHEPFGRLLSASPHSERCALVSAAPVSLFKVWEALGESTEAQLRFSAGDKFMY